MNRSEADLGADWQLCHCAAESGAALMEFALALPIIVLLFLTCTEYVRALQVQQTMAVVTREAANAAFRDCMERDEMAECLQGIQRQVGIPARVALPTLEIIISVYTCDYDAALQRCNSIRLAGIDPPGSESRSRFSVADFGGFLDTHRKITIAETFLTFSPIIENAPISRDFYDAAIY